MRYVLMHMSDLHAGPPFNATLAARVAEEAHELKPDLLVVSGDLVQRADFPRQWQVITAYLTSLPEPRLVVPGNHDVPLFHVFNRLFRPMAQYKRHITTNLTPVFEQPGLMVVGGNTAHGWTSDGGHMSDEAMAAMEQAFNRCPPGTCKVAVLHHHVVNPPGHEGRNKINNADEVVAMLDRCGVDLLLCGHIHMSYVGTTLDVINDLQSGTIICQSGTTTSWRGARREAGKNSYNIIVIEDRTIRISQHLYLEQTGHFEAVAEHLFPRRSGEAYVLPREERMVEEG